jgi:cell wall-associated NlpC family hydrolase
VTVPTRSMSAALVLAALLTVLAPAGSAHAAPTASGVRTVDLAARYAGVPYRYGGTTPRGFDCSGFTRFVLARLGVAIPRTSQAQYDRARKVAKRNVRIGDLVFFHSGSTRNVYHVGIYAGGKRIWHSPRPGRVVSLDPIWTARWVAGRY